jgi:hypothetical protein
MEGFVSAAVQKVKSVKEEAGQEEIPLAPLKAIKFVNRDCDHSSS